jgi:hypothetical protein
VRNLSLLLFPTVLFAAFSSSPSYQLKSYGVSPGGTNSSSSATYNLQGTAGEQTNGTSTGQTAPYTANSGSIQTEQINVPPAPTLSNVTYNSIKFTLDSSKDPSDATYAVAISSNNFVTTNYINSAGVLAGSAVYQTYASWGGSSGTNIVGLANNTTYEVKVAAMEGQFTNTEFGPFASATTTTPSVTFSVSPNSVSLGNLLPGSVVTSSNITLGFTTNALSGGAVYVYGANGGLRSTSRSFTIPAFTGDLSSQSQGFGVQATAPTQTSGGPFTLASPFNGTSHTVGAETVVPQQIVFTTSPITGGSANTNFQAITSSTTPSASDYQETLTFNAAANF